MRISSILTLVAVLAIRVQAGLEIKIDSITCKLNAKDSLASLNVLWRLCNTGHDTVRNVDGLWYKLVANVKYDSIIWKCPKEKIEKSLGIGNTRITVRQGDTTSFCDNIAVVDVPLISYDRSTLFPGNIKRGSTGGIFKIVRNKIDSLEVQIEYDTRFQKDGGKPLWRGRLLSNKLIFKFPQNHAVDKHPETK